jgi:hypothetical protein
LSFFEHKSIIISDDELDNFDDVAHCDDDEIPEVIEDPITRLGDVWLLDNHRLMCGDSTMISDIEKLMDGKTYNQGIINHIQFFKNINKIISILKAKYTNLKSLSGYINAVTSILSRVREYFPNEYNKIAILNNDLAKNYNRDRDTNDAPDEVIDKLISFDPVYINKLLAGMKNINDKALLAVYTLAPPRRIMDYQLMRITYQTDITKLNKNFNWVIFKNDIPYLFVFLNHKTKKSQPEPKITIPTDLATILYTYVNNKDMVKNDMVKKKPAST